jgi:hypothetical protein
VLLLIFSLCTNDTRIACSSPLFKQTPYSLGEGPETERSSDNLLCFPAEHTVYPMTVKTASTRFALKKRFSQFVTLDAQVSTDSLRRMVFVALLRDKCADASDVRGHGVGWKAARIARQSVSCV